MSLKKQIDVFVPVKRSLDNPSDRQEAMDLEREIEQNFPKTFGFHEFLKSKGVLSQNGAIVYEKTKDYEDYREMWGLVQNLRMRREYSRRAEMSPEELQADDATFEEKLKEIKKNLSDKLNVKPVSELDEYLGPSDISVEKEHTPIIQDDEDIDIKDIPF